MLLAAHPVFLVADIMSTIRWYQDVLGFEGDSFPSSPPHFFGILRKDNVVIMLQMLEAYRKPELYEHREGGVWNVYVRTDGVRPLFASLSSRSDVIILEPLRVQPYGETEFVIRDPNGYVLVFAQRE